MPNAFRTTSGEIWRAGQQIPLTLQDGSVVIEKWAGSATEERLDWWLRRGSGNLLARTVPVAAIGTNDSGELLWADTPPDAYAFFVIASEPGKNYRLAKMVTTAASPALTTAIRHDRFALLGQLTPTGTIAKMTPPDPPAPPPPAQGELF